MHKGLIGVISFSAGFGIGVLAIKNVISRFYEQKAEEEIASVRRAFQNYSGRGKTRKAKGPEAPAKKETVASTRTSTSIKDMPPPAKRDYQKYYAENGTSVALSDKDENKDVLQKSRYVIPPSEYGMMEDSGYDTESLTLFADGTLAYTHTGEILSDEEKERIISADSLDHIGDYELDAVHVRNDDLKIDYEVLASDEDYSTNRYQSK